jgi:hypothetical protein
MRNMDVDDLSQPLAERRGRREHRRLPLRYRDILPDTPAPLPPPLHLFHSTYPADEIVAQTSSPDIPATSGPSSTLPLVRRPLKSPHNIFGLFRQYHATCFPEHDPDENLTTEDFMDPPPDSSSSPQLISIIHIPIDLRFC